MTPFKVFVYGSLKKGMSNHDYLEYATFIKEDTVTGAMVSLGAFPAITLQHNKVVHGEVYEVNEQEMALLDRLEGFPHFYHRSMVRTLSGEVVWVYHIEKYDLLEVYEEVKDGKWK